MGHIDIGSSDQHNFGTEVCLHRLQTLVSFHASCVRYFELLAFPSPNPTAHASCPASGQPPTTLLFVRHDGDEECMRSNLLTKQEGLRTVT